MSVTVFAASQAKAYYNPATGRWLSRDPLSETGFEMVCAAGTGSQVGQVVSTSKPPGRWLNRDPIEDDGFYNLDSTVGSDRDDEDNTVNLYSFVHNNPVNQIDLFGLIGDTYGERRLCKRCKLCIPPAGTRMYAFHNKHDHWPYTIYDGHTHHYIVTQSPPTALNPCVCRRSNGSPKTTKGNSPAPGEIPEQDVSGGGIEDFPWMGDE